jgi:hypothetical protein
MCKNHKKYVVKPQNLCGRTYVFLSKKTLDHRPLKKNRVW